MADNTLNNDVDTTTQNDTEPATKHDVGIGGGLGAVGGAIVGALAGGPVGAVIGAIAGGAVSAGAVDIVDKHDHDYARTPHDSDATAVGTGAYADDATTTRGTEYTGPGDYQRTPASYDTTTAPAGTVGTGSYDTTTPTSTFAADTTTTPRTGIDGDQKVELYEEELHANKERVQAGEVTLHKEVITETKSIDVPVTREEVVIERHAVSGGQAAGNVNLGTDEVIRVPVMEEQVNVEKTAVVTGEVGISKRQVTETQHVQDTVRREEAHIENTGNVDVVERGDRA